MNTQPERPEEWWIKEFDEKFPVRPSLEDPERMVMYSREEFGLIEAEVSDIKEFIAKLIQQAEEKVATDILVFLDELEMRQPEDLKNDNWRNWKYIRNSIVDKYKIPTQFSVKPSEGEEK